MPYAANLEKLALPNVDEVVEAVKAVTLSAERRRIDADQHPDARALAHHGRRAISPSGW